MLEPPYAQLAPSSAGPVPLPLTALAASPKGIEPSATVNVSVPQASIKSLTPTAPLSVLPALLPALHARCFPPAAQTATLMPTEYWAMTTWETKCATVFQVTVLTLTETVCSQIVWLILSARPA